MTITPQTRTVALTAGLVCLLGATASWAQQVASAKRAEASPERIVQALNEGNLSDALDYYRALVNKTNKLHAPSLRRICVVVIREALENNSADVRIQAARALRHTVDAETVPLVLEVIRQRKVPEEFIINEPFLPVRPEGLLPVARKALDDGDKLVRVWAVQTLTEIGGPQVVEPLSKALDDPFFWVRLQAVLGLGRLNPELLPVERLRPLCDDPSPPVAMDAAAVLYAHGEKDMKERLLKAFSDPDYHLARHFAVVAETLKAPPLNELLLGLLEHRSPAVRMRAAQAVGRLGLTQAVSRLMGLLSDPEVPVRAAAVQALGEVGYHRAVGELERLAGTGEGQLKVAAVTALGKLGNPAVLATLRRALVDEDPTVRLAAAQALGHIKGEEVIPLLQNVYTNRQETASVRAHAAVSAARLGDYPAVVQLNTDAQDKDYYVRVWAAWGLGEVGERAQLFTLVNMLADEDEMVRPVSAGALLKLSNRLEEAETGGS